MCEFHSCSSAMMLHTTIARNHSGCAGTVVGQIGYGLTIGISCVETTVALAASAISLLAYPFSSTPFTYATQWLRSSAFAIGWSLVDFCFNPFATLLVADECSAREVWRSGDWLKIPDQACTTFFASSGNQTDFPGKIWSQRNKQLFEA